MDFVVELLFDLIVEGSLELGTSRKVPKSLRILAICVFLLIVGGFIVLFLLITIAIMKNSGIIPGMAFVVLDLLMLTGLVSAIRKKLKQRE